MLEIGTKAPAFTLPDQNGEMRSLADYLGQKVVLYFYPKDMTAGCTKQACAFGELYPQFREKGAVVHTSLGSGERSDSGIRCLEGEKELRKGYDGSCPHDVSD